MPLKLSKINIIWSKQFNPYLSIERCEDRCFYSIACITVHLASHIINNGHKNILQDKECSESKSFPQVGVITGHPTDDQTENIVHDVAFYVFWYVCIFY